MTTTQNINLDIDRTSRKEVGTTIPFKPGPDYFCPVCKKYQVFKPMGNFFYCTKCKVLFIELPMIARGEISV